MGEQKESEVWQDEQFRLISQMRQHTDSTISYLAGETYDEGYKLVGSGTFVEVGGTPFLLTAEHVIYLGTGPKFRELYYFTGSGRRLDNVHYKVYKSKEPTDLAMFRVDRDIFDGTGLKAISLG